MARPCKPGPTARGSPGGSRAVSMSPAWSISNPRGVRIDPSGDVLVRSGMSSQGQGAGDGLRADRGGGAGGGDRPRFRRDGRHGAPVLRTGGVREPGRDHGRQRGPSMRRRRCDPGPWKSRRNSCQDEAADLDIVGGRVVRRTGGDTGLALGEVASAGSRPAGRCSTAARGSKRRPCGVPTGPRPLAYSVHAGARGRSTPRRVRSRWWTYAIGHDIGRTLNPALVDGQVAGGAAEGIANALAHRNDPSRPMGSRSRLTLADYLAGNRRRRTGPAPGRTGDAIAHQPARHPRRRRERRHRAARDDLERGRPGDGGGMPCRPGSPLPPPRWAGADTRNCM